MKDYQLSGLAFMIYLHNNGTSGLLGDEMGLGKTLQTLSLFQYLEEQRKENSSQSADDEIRPYLVVCPLSVLSSWMAEAKKWAPSLTALRFHGPAHERAMLKKVVTGQMDRFGNVAVRGKMAKSSRAVTSSSFASLTESGPFKLVVTSYETFAAEKEWFKRVFVWRYVVLDEGHKIKNDLTQISTALQGIRAQYRLILSGTPLQNNLLEMWALLHWLYPNVFTEKTSELFKRSFDLSKGQVRTDIMDHARRLLELICLRRMKDSPTVNLGLPPKEEVLLYVPLTPMQRFWYTRLLTKAGDGLLNEIFENAGRKEKAVFHAEATELTSAIETEQLPEANASTNEWAETQQILKDALEQEESNASRKDTYRRLRNLIMQLRKVCAHPYVLEDVAPEPYFLGEHISKASGKFIVLQKLLQDLVVHKRKKVLIFSGFTRTLDLTQDLLALIGGDGSSFKYSRFDGSTSRTRRNLAIRLFNAASDYKVMLISTRAGGLGINLATATEVIFLDEDWNPQITIQAEARAHRIGQTQPVTVYKLCTQGTVEEQMLGRIRKKLYLSTKITESMQNIHSTPSKKKKNGKRQGRPADDMPQMDTGTLKSLIRRGAQTLSHPDIDPTEMLSWDLQTIIEKCKDKPSDTTIDSTSSTGVVQEPDEQQWLATLERVECAVFEGKQVHRKMEEERSTVLPDSVSRGDRRKDKNTTVMVNGYAVSKESLQCGDWEAVPTLAGKDRKLADRVKPKREPINNQEHCQACWDGGELLMCTRCPRSYHYECLSDEFKSKTKSISFICSQHSCFDCAKNSSDAGGMVYRCRWCSRAYCEDCLDFEGTTLLGENLLEYETLGFKADTTAFYVECAPCLESHREDAQLAAFVENQRGIFRKNHEKILEKARLEAEKAEKKEAKEKAKIEKKQAEQAKTQTLTPKDASGPRLTLKISGNGNATVTRTAGQEPFRIGHTGSNIIDLTLDSDDDSDGDSHPSGKVLTGSSTTAMRAAPATGPALVATHLYAPMPSSDALTSASTRTTSGIATPSADYAVDLSFFASLSNGGKRKRPEMEDEEQGARPKFSADSYLVDDDGDEVMGMSSLDAFY